MLPLSQTGNQIRILQQKAFINRIVIPQTNNNNHYTTLFLENPGELVPEKLTKYGFLMAWLITGTLLLLIQTVGPPTGLQQP